MKVKIKMHSSLFLAACAAPLVLSQGCGGRTVARADEAGKDAGAAQSTATVTAAVEKQPYAILETNKGRITVKLLPEAAPKTVTNFVDLATGKKSWTDPSTRQHTQRPLFNGTIFHRVIPEFMIQGGDPLGNGTGGPGYTFEDEFSPSHALNEPGLMAMANSGPNTNGSQFFITVAPTPWLTNHHAVFGEVVEGYDVAVAISKVSRDANDRPLEPVILREVKVEYR